MCVIIYKPKGVKIPSATMMNMMHRVNHDGCGPCSPSTFFKTLNFNAFKKCVEMQDVNEPMLIHFRWATHGSVCTDNCHPFYDSKTDTYFMHNGVLNIKPYHDRTDSETLFRKYLTPALNVFDLDSMDFKDIVDDFIGGSKFAFMQGENVRLFGEWTKYNGCYYSNLRFINYARLF